MTDVRNIPGWPLGKGIFDSSVALVERAARGRPLALLALSARRSSTRVYSPVPTASEQEEDRAYGAVHEWVDRGPVVLTTSAPLERDTRSQDPEEFDAVLITPAVR
jgi:hypothetical protein